MITLAQPDYRDRVHGAWLGKLIGGALGAAFDGRKQSPDLSGYPELLAPSQPVSCEGVDFQFAWLRALQCVGPKLTSEDLISAWLRHLAHSDGEYPYARANFRRDLPPPVSGVFDNPFRESLGAFARADLWGLLAPGDPALAASFAYRDAVLDHSGNGVLAAIWLAAVVSAAFVEREPPRLLEIGLAFLPNDSRLARALRDVVRWNSEHANWTRTREMLLRAYNSDDVRDAIIAACFTALALLQGRGDFARSLLAAAGCGWSTLPTCASTGTVLGLLHGAANLPHDWRRLTREEFTAGWALVGLPPTLPCAHLADQTCDLGRLALRSESAGRVQLLPDASDDPPKLPDPDTSVFLRELAVGPYVTTYRRGPLLVQVDYDGPPTIGYDRPRRLIVALHNTTNRSLEVQSRLSTPAGFVVTTVSEASTLPEGASVSFLITCSAPRDHARLAVANPCTLFLSVDDAAEFTVPITLIGEALWFAAGPYGSFDEVHAPEQPDLLSGQQPLGGEGWTSLSVPEPSVNLLSSLEGTQGTYYLATDLYAPRARRARLHLACNDGLRAWFNGLEAWYQHEHRAVSPLSADEFAVELREGRNRLLIKLAQCGPRRYLSLSLRNSQGQLLVDADNCTLRA